MLRSRPAPLKPTTYPKPVVPPNDDPDEDVLPPELLGVGTRSLRRHIAWERSYNDDMLDATADERADWSSVCRIVDDAYASEDPAQIDFADAVWLGYLRDSGQL
jgi:hypothetical protein